MPSFQAKLVNFVGYGARTQRFSKRSWSRDRFEFELDNRRIKIVQRAAVRTFGKAQFRGRTVASSAVTIFRVGSFREGEVLLNDLCWLLSFATHSPVLPYKLEFGGNAKIYDTLHRYNSWRPPFEFGGSEMVGFIAAAWPRYQKLKDSRALEGLIHLIVTSDAPGTLLETQVTTGVQCLECIKTYFALSEGRRFHITEQVNGTFKGPKNSTSFEKLMELALDDVGMKLPEEFEVIKRLRNAIVHRGFVREQDQVATHIFGALKPGAMHRAMFRTFEQTQDLIREYMLRLLGYKGDYLPYSHAGRGRATLS